MEVKLVKIGNSKGVRLPRPILDQVGFSDKAELVVEEGHIVLKPLDGHIRAGWDRAFALDPDRDDPERDEWLAAPLTNDDDWTW